MIDWLNGEITDDITATLEATTASRGFTSHLMRAMANAPQAQHAHMRYGHFLRFDTSLTELQRELIICYTVRGSDYAWAHHSGLLANLDGELDLAAVRAGQVSGTLRGADAAIAEFTLQYATSNGVDDATMTRAQSFFTPEQIVEAALLSSYYLGGAAIINMFRLPIDSQEALDIEVAAQATRLAGKA